MTNHFNKRAVIVGHASGGGHVGLHHLLLGCLAQLHGLGTMAHGREATGLESSGSWAEVSDPGDVAALHGGLGEKPQSADGG